MSNKMDISSLTVAQSCWCGNEGKIFSFLCNNFVDFTHYHRLHLLLQSQFSTSEEDAGIRVLSSCRATDQQFYLAAFPWTFTYRSLPPLISVPAFMQASKPCSLLSTDPLATSCGCVAVVSRISGVRRGRIQVLTLFERSAEHIPHLCQQDCLCNRLNSQRASTSLLINRNNRYTWKIIFETSLNKSNSYFSFIEAKAFDA